MYCSKFLNVMVNIFRFEIFIIDVSCVFVLSSSVSGNDYIVYISTENTSGFSFDSKRGHFLSPFSHSEHGMKINRSFAYPFKSHFSQENLNNFYPYHNNMTLFDTFSSLFLVLLMQFIYFCPKTGPCRI